MFWHWLVWQESVGPCEYWNSLMALAFYVVDEHMMFPPADLEV